MPVTRNPLIPQKVWTILQDARAQNMTVEELSAKYPRYAPGNIQQYLLSHNETALPSKATQGKGGDIPLTASDGNPRSELENQVAGTQGASGDFASLLPGSFDVGGTYGPTGTKTIKPLNDNELSIYRDAMLKGENADVLGKRYGIKPKRITERLNQAGLTLYDTSGFANQKLRNIFVDAFMSGKTVSDLDKKHKSVSGEQIQTYLNKLGLGNTLTGVIPNTVKTGLNDKGEGLAAAGARENPAGTVGEVPRTPGLRHVRAAMLRRSDPNWRGQTDRIFTSGKGVTEEAAIRKPTLTGTV